MKQHPMKGTAVKVEEGPFKGQYFKVIDYLVNQYQGKDIQRIAESQARLVTPVVGRGYPLDDKIVFGQIYPAMEFMCLHDNELKIKTAKVPLKIVEEEKEDDSGTTSQGDNSAPVAGSTESDGRSVPSAEIVREDAGPAIETEQDSAEAGSGDSGPEEKSPPANERKTKSPKRKA